MIWSRKKFGKIFISYRRSDTQGYAGRLSDSLERYFGEKRVFRDIEDIKGGSEFAKDIGSSLKTADALIVLIGSNWLSASNQDGTRRIDTRPRLVGDDVGQVSICEFFRKDAGD